MTSSLFSCKTTETSSETVTTPTVKKETEKVDRKMTVENKVERTMPQKLQPTEISNPKFEKPTEEQ